MDLSSLPSELHICASFISRCIDRWPQQYVMYSTNCSPLHSLPHTLAMSCVLDQCFVLSVLFSEHSVSVIIRLLSGAREVIESRFEFRLVVISFAPVLLIFSRYSRRSYDKESWIFRSVRMRNALGIHSVKILLGKVTSQEEWFWSLSVGVDEETGTMTQ